MAGFSTLDIATDARGVATLTLSRPKRHNAMDAAMIRELTEAAEILGRDESVRVVVLTGAGKSFCAGADLNWMRAQFEASREARIQEAQALAGMLNALNTLPKPLIGRINGQAYGGGLGLIAVCDLCIAVCEARFAFTETRLGLIPATISPFVAAKMGEARARRVFFTPRVFPASEAVDLGLVSKAVAPEALDAAVAAEVAPVLDAVPAALARGKALLRSLGPVIDQPLLDRCAQSLADCWESEEALSGIADFLDRKAAKR